MQKETDEAIVGEAFEELVRLYEESNHRRKTARIRAAWRLARRAHGGRRDLSGQPRLLHQIGVAKIVLTEFGLGSTSICASLLHEVLEDDSDISVADIEAAVGPHIASIVEGLYKISGGIFGEKASVQAEDYRRLLLSMSTDVRVVLVKMADRLHNMRNLALLLPEKQRKIAEETQHVYAPLAHRLGLYNVKTELEDLSFRFEHPRLYAEILNKLSKSKADRQRIVEEFVAPMRRKLDEAGFKYEIKARVKSPFSIFRKMQKKGIPFEEVYDIYALRVIFENDDPEQERLRCWQIYTIFTDGRRIHPDRLRDWTSTPKANGYRALHMTVMGPQGRWVEVQIRSRQMDEVAELGYAAHWRYKDGTDAQGIAALTELDSWMNIIKDILAHPDPEGIDALETIRLNLYSKEIFVFTPKGELLQLPKGATVLDMAFAIDIELGLHCLAAKVGHKMVPPSFKLSSGDQVEIISSDWVRPDRSWPERCITAKAQNGLLSQKPT